MEHLPSDYEEHTKYKLSLIKSNKNLKSYLMLLCDKNFSCHVYAKTSVNLKDDPVLQKLIYNLGCEYTVTPMDSDTDFYIEVFRNDTLVDTAQFTDYKRIQE